MVIYHQGFSYINLIDVDRSGGEEGVGIYIVSVVYTVLNWTSCSRLSLKLTG